jgi:hypothetical protein
MAVVGHSATEHDVIPSRARGRNSGSEVDPLYGVRYTRTAAAAPVPERAIGQCPDNRWGSRPDPSCCHNLSLRIQEGKAQARPSPFAATPNLVPYIPQALRASIVLFLTAIVSSPTRLRTSHFSCV